MAANDPSPRWLQNEAKQKLLYDQQEEENEELRELEEAAVAGTGVSGRRSKSPYSSSAAASQNKKPYKKSKKASLKLEEDEEEEEDGEEVEERRKHRKITKPFFAVLSTFTILLGLALIASNFYSIVNKEEEKQDGKGKEGEGEAVLLLRHVYHAFAILLSIPAILTELSIKWWKKLCPLLSYLFFRGLFYCLIACLSVDDFTPASENIAGFIFLGFGMFYMILGGLCVKRHVET